MIVRIDDCKTRDHIEMPLYRDDGELNPNLIGRMAAKKFTTKRGRGAAQAEPGDRLGRGPRHR